MRTRAALLRHALRKHKELALAHSYLGAVLFRQDNISGADALCQVLAHAGRVNEVDALERSLAARFPREGEVACCRVLTGSLELWAP